MATVTKPEQHWDRDETQRRVAHPLERLRGSIRAYVSAEGLAILALFLLLWFWIGLLLDYGVFKALGVDWVQELPWMFRAVVLCALVAAMLALVASKVLVRLLREFNDAALALVLERRFPSLLGDRLITAVEMADPRVAECYGYSQAMIDETIRAAAERVDRLPLGEVFDWRRLRRAAMWVAGLSLGIYLLLAVSYCLIARVGVASFASSFNNVAVIWFERNVLLGNSIWPRRAYLELVNFPPSGDLRVGRNAPPPAVRVRALKWVIADAAAPEGWRALTWADLTAGALGLRAEPAIVPAEWQDWPVDRIEMAMDKADLPVTVQAEALRQAFQQLEQKAADPSMARRLRKLLIPDGVVVYYRGETIRSEQTLKKQADQEYSGVLSDLKESVRFRVNGEDYYTPYQRITVVPPPSLVELTRDEEQPAYLYHRPPVGAEPSYLKGKKQLFEDLPVSLSGSASHIDVPAGTNVVLRGKTDKLLRMEEGVRIRPREGSAPIQAPVRQADAQSFEVRFDNIRTPLDFVLELTDTDNVVGLRPVIIKPLDDTPPEVDVLVEVIRKTNQGYMTSPSARIPLSGKIRDDHGLSDVIYAYTLVSVDSQAVAGARPVVSAFQYSPRGLGADLLSIAYLGYLTTVIHAATEETNKPPEKVPLGAFARRIREVAAEDVSPAVFEQRLRQKPSRGLLRDHTLDYSEEFKERVPGDDFDVRQLGLKVSEDQETQGHYRLRLWVVATDNNVETGPGVGQSKEKFTFLIVSEDELLVEIGKEEEGLHVKLEDTVTKLKDARNKLDQVMQELPGLKPDEFSPMARRNEEILEALAKGWDVSREVYMDYRKILRELQYNRARPKIIEKVERNICEPLDGAINHEFVRAEEALRALYKTLEGKQAELSAAKLARAELEKLIDRLTRVLDAMGEITHINKLIEQLRQIEIGVRKGSERFKELTETLQEKLFDEALNPPPKPQEKKP
jgi:hypothetical protein